MHCSRITGLNISYNKKISDEGIVTVARRCVRLVDVDLSWCRRITDRSLLALAQNCTSLEKVAALRVCAAADRCPPPQVNLSRCRSVTGRGVEQLVSACPRMKSLDLKGCIAIDGIRIVSPSLHNINFSVRDAAPARWLTVMQGCENLFEDSVTMLQCPSLLTLSVSTALKITDVAISKVRPYSQLSVLNTPGLA